MNIAYSLFSICCFYYEATYIQLLFNYKIDIEKYLIDLYKHKMIYSENRLIRLKAGDFLNNDNLKRDCL